MSHNVQLQRKSIVFIALAALLVLTTLTPGVQAQGTACSPVTATITAPFYFDGAGAFCWQSNNLGAYINSWNVTSLTVNGTNYTNIYVSTSSLPAQISGYWYVAYNSSVAWGHFEAAGTGGATATNTVPGPTATPTRTNTPGGATNTPTRTATQPSGSTVYQAESAVLGGGSATESTNGGYNGTGYVNFPASGGTLEFQNVNGGTGGSQTIRFRNALGVTTARTGQLTINGSTQNITFDPTGAWTTWLYKDVVVTLNSGTSNTIRLTTNGQDLANIDELVVGGVTGPTNTPTRTNTQGTGATNTPTRTPTRTNTTGPTPTRTRTPTPGGGGNFPPWPTPQGDVLVTASIAVSGVFDGGMKRYIGSGPLGTGGQDESQDPIFDLAAGATLKNVILGNPAADGVHCAGACTLQNVWWEDVGEDAATFRGSSSSIQSLVDGGGARHATDKTFQHNGAGTLTIRNFQLEDFGKLYRSCGNCSTQYQRNVVINNVRLTAGSTVAGVNTNYGDTARFSLIYIVNDPSMSICDRFTGNNTGDEPTKTGSGADGTYCIYSPSDIIYQ